jgi:peptide/nickel transport system permease protein
MNAPLRIGLVLLICFLIISVLGPFLPFIDRELEENMYLKDDEGKVIQRPYLPSSEFPLGSDRQGRDMLSLLVMGASKTLFFVLIVSVVRFVIAIPLAMLASRGSGFFFHVVKGWSNLFSIFPALFIAILLINNPLVVAAEYRTLWVILIISLIEVGRVSMIFQQQFNQLLHSSVVESGRMVGNNDLGIYRKYILPFVLPQISVNFALDIGRVILIVAQLCLFSIFFDQMFMRDDVGKYIRYNLSLDWFYVLSDTRFYIRTHPWVPFWPAIAISLAIIMFNLLGEGLRQWFENRHTSKYNRKLEEKTLNAIEKKSDGTIAK